MLRDVFDNGNLPPGVRQADLDDRVEAYSPLAGPQEQPWDAPEPPAPEDEEQGPETPEQFAARLEAWDRRVREQCRRAIAKHRALRQGNGQREQKECAL